MARMNVGMIGYAFMGRAHSQAFRTVARFFDVPSEPVMKVICGRSADAVEKARQELGWEEAETDWRKVVERDDIDLIDVSTPGSSHKEIAIAALEAGKHVLCEKPLANTVEEAKEMAEAAKKASANGVRSMVAFNYRRVPAAALAKKLIADGRLGEIRHVRAVYLQDWIVDPEFPLVWRLVEEEAGSGALGDIGSHIVDLSQYMLGDRITEVTGLTETFEKERPLPEVSGTGGLEAAGGSKKGKVTVDDAALFVGRFGNGAVGTFEATRFATGRRNGMKVEVNGSKGSLVFDLERLNELELYSAEDSSDAQGFRRILVTEGEHPWMSAWWPPGHIIGWEHTFTHEVKDMLDDIGAGRDPEPSFEDGLQVQQVLDAVIRSSKQGGWQKP